MFNFNTNGINDENMSPLELSDHKRFKGTLPNP